MKILLLVLFGVFSLIFIYLFMYQRVAWENERRGGSFSQRKLTLPLWFGCISYIVLFILIALLILIWLKVGWLWSVILFIVAFSITLWIPLPRKYFEKKFRENIIKNSMRSR